VAQKSQRSSKGKQITLAFSFEMEFFWDGKVRWHFILFKMATHQSGLLFCKTHLQSDNCPILNSLNVTHYILYHRVFIYHRDSFPLTNHHMNSVLPALDFCYLFFFSKMVFSESFSFLGYASQLRVKSQN
jgi:hypothetical protein